MNKRNGIKKESLETTAVFTPADGGYVISFPAVPGLTFHTVNLIEAELEDALDIALAREAEARNDFVRWEDVRDSL